MWTRVDTPSFKQSVWPRAWSDFRTRKEKSQVGIGAAILGALAALIRYHGDRWWEAALWTTGGVVVGFLAAYVFVLGRCALMAASRQRDDARDAARAMQDELDERDRPRFAAKGYTERLDPLQNFDIDEGKGATIHYGDVTVFWVRVTNDGPSGTFTARLSEISGKPVPEHHSDIENVAWESTIEAVRDIARGGSARLILGTYARRPDTRVGAYAPCFWFWMARSAIWAPNAHGYDWRLRELPGETIDFNLEIVNITFDKSDRWQGRITFPRDPGAGVEFDLEHDDGSGVRDRSECRINPELDRSRP
jgi:hypothetical protein